MDDALGARHAAVEGERRAVGQRVVHSRVELRLAGALVGVFGVGRVEGVADRAHGTRQRILREVAGGDLVGHLVVHRLRVRPVHVEQRAGVAVHVLRATLEPADPDRERTTRPRPPARAASW